jgi:hypothetical protein
MCFIWFVLVTVRNVRRYRTRPRRERGRNTADRKKPQSRRIEFSIQIALFYSSVQRSHSECPVLHLQTSNSQIAGCQRSVFVMSFICNCLFEVQHWSQGAKERGENILFSPAKIPEYLWESARARLNSHQQSRRVEPHLTPKS